AFCSYVGETHVKSLPAPIPLKRHPNRVRRAVRGAVEDGFNVVAVGVEQKSGIITRMIRAIAGGAVVFAAGIEATLIKSVHHVFARRLKGEVRAARVSPLRRWAVGGG